MQGQRYRKIVTDQRQIRRDASLLEDVNLHFRIFILRLPSYQRADNSDIHVDVSDFSREYRKLFDTQRFSRKSPPAHSKKNQPKSLRLIEDVK